MSSESELNWEKPINLHPQIVCLGRKALIPHRRKTIELEPVRALRITSETWEGHHIENSEWEKKRTKKNKVLQNLDFFEEKDWYLI